MLQNAGDGKTQNIFFTRIQLLNTEMILWDRAVYTDLTRELRLSKLRIDMNFYPVRKYKRNKMHNPPIIIL